VAEPRASVVIPVRNGGPRLRECLEAVAAQTLAGGHELIVIDSGSEDGSAELARDYGRLFRIRPERFNHGLTRNLGVEAARGRSVALLVQDAVPLGRDWLRPLVEAVERPEVAGAYSRQLPRLDCPPFIRARLERWSAGRPGREEKALADEAALLTLAPLERIRLLAFDNVSSCLKKEVWRRCPFPERRFGGGVRFAQAALLAGYKIIYEPASTVEHSHANSMWYEFRRVYLDHRNWREVAEAALFNRPLEVLQASWNGVPERWAELRAQGLTGPAKWWWGSYALPYSLSQNLAQYLGSRSYKAALRFRWWSRVDDFIARGI
jgi:rhamnosyltransferase